MIFHDTDAENLFLNHTDSEKTLSNYDVGVDYFRRKKKLLDIQVITSSLANTS